MSISIQYSSTRREVWGFYCRMWQQRLWRTHLMIFVPAALFGSFAVFGHWPSGLPEMLGMMLIGFVPIAFLVVYPMLMFKPQMRVLTIDRDGIATTIGKHNGSIAWQDIADVQDTGDAFVIQGQNLNAFIVPARAFTTPEARSSFEDFVRTHVQAR